MTQLADDAASLHYRFRSVFDATASGFWIVDLAHLKRMLDDAGIADARDLRDHLETDPSFVRRALDNTPIIEVNAKAAKIFGVDPADARGQPLGRWCSDKSVTAFTANLFAFLGGERSFETETVMLRTDGRPVDIFLSCAFATNATDETAVIVGTADISARIAKENEFARAKDDLAHAARIATLGELTATIAHEVNQPLAAVLANGNAALRWLNRPEPDAQEVGNALRRMISECSRAAEIIARTRRLARKGERQLAPVEINAMIGETVAIVRRQVAALDADLRLDLAPDPITIVADRIQLQQVLLNLILNAAQAMSEQAGARRICIRSSADPERAIVEVADTGPGLGEPVERLFEPFYTTKATGMGIGLSISQSILEAHDGSLDALNEPGGGALFIFSVPLSASEPGIPARSEGPAGKRPSARP